jgi:hypothetical protein
MPTDDFFLFVSHVSEDRPAALEIVGELEKRGIRCWIAPRNVRPGHPFDDEIVDAIEGSRAMVLIFSGQCNDSEYIRREVTVAGESQKTIIPFRIEDTQPKKGLRIRLSDLHWIDGFVSRERAIDELVASFGTSARAPETASDLSIGKRKTEPPRAEQLFTAKSGKESCNEDIARALSQLAKQFVSASGTVELERVNNSVERFLADHPSNMEALQLRERINSALEQKRRELRTKDKPSLTASENPAILNASKSLFVFWKPIRTLKEANSLILMSVVYFAVIAGSAWITLVFGLGSDILWMPDHAMKNVYYLMYLSPGTITEWYVHYAVTAGLFTGCAVGLYLRFRVVGIIVSILMFLVLVVSLEEFLRWQPMWSLAPLLYSTVGLLLGIGSIRAMSSFPSKRRKGAVS